jgi:hypothetical protein
MFIHDIADFLVNLTCKDIKPDIYSVFDSPSENNCPNNVNSEKLTILEILNAIGCRLKNMFGFVKINTTTETIDKGEAVVNVNGDVDNLNFDFKIPRGKPGPQGPAGPGVATGGTTGQVLAKKSNTNYDTEWINFYPYVPVGGVIEWDGTGLPNAPDLSTPEKVAAFYGYGTWARYGVDRVTIGAGGEYTAGSTGGEKEHTLTVEEMPSHNHSALYGGGSGSQYGFSIERNSIPGQYESYALQKTGSSQPHNNMPPYVGTYKYRRIA